MRLTNSADQLNVSKRSTKRLSVNVRTSGSFGEDEASSREAPGIQSTPSLEVLLSDGSKKAESEKELMVVKRRTKCNSFGNNPMMTLNVAEDDGNTSEGHSTRILAAVRIKNRFFGGQEHHGPATARGKKKKSADGDDDLRIPESEEMMSTTELLDLIKECRRLKAKSSSSKQNPYQSIELHQHYKEQHTSISRLSQYKGLVLAIETEEKVHDALFKMVNALILILILCTCS